MLFKFTTLNTVTQLIEIRFRGSYKQDPVYNSSKVMTGVTDNRGRSLTFTPNPTTAFQRFRLAARLLFNSTTCPDV